MRLLLPLEIALPVAFQNILSGGAQVISTRIVAPLGTVAIAANSFAVTYRGLLLYARLWNFHSHLLRW